MNHLIKKINKLKWLQAIGIEYYYSASKVTMEKTIEIKEKKPFMQLNTKTQFDHELIPNNKSRFNKITIQDDNSHSNVIVARSLADSASNIDELKESLLTFDGCSLKKLANNTVFGDGNPQSSVMFIGEAPGSNEDATGIPFCGESGKLLDNMLSSINISRKHNAYITNTIFWRPPANRQPTQEEVDICRPFVEKHIAIINPKLIILVGNVAATSLLGQNAGISKIRQEYYLYINKYLTKPINTTTIFHPAYLLRQPMQKKTTWYDLIKIQQFLEHFQ